MWVCAPQFSDQFVLDTYVRTAVKNGEDASGDRARLFTYFVKANMWACCIAMSRATILFLISQYGDIPSLLLLCRISLSLLWTHPFLKKNIAGTKHRCLFLATAPAKALRPWRTLMWTLGTFPRGRRLPLSGEVSCRLQNTTGVWLFSFSSHPRHLASFFREARVYSPPHG